MRTAPLLLAALVLLAAPGSARAGAAFGYYADGTFGVQFDDGGGVIDLRASTKYPGAFQIDSGERLVPHSTVPEGTCEEEPPTTGTDPWRYHCQQVSPSAAVVGGAGSEFVNVYGLTGPVSVDGAGGFDVIALYDIGARASARGGPGSDVLTGRPPAGRTASVVGGVTLDGGDGDDHIIDAFGTDGAPADALDGGAGDDRLYVDGGGPGTAAGGVGHDVASVQEGDARLSLDGTANDGPVRSGIAPLMNLAGDVETLVGGAGADVLRGNGATNQLRGGPGPDDLDAGGGADVVHAGPGADRIAARDGVPDAISCGEDSEAEVAADSFDELSGCESVSASDALQPDRDGDGLAAPDDCDDANPAIRPGRPDRPGNGVDEDCAGGDAVAPAATTPAAPVAAEVLLSLSRVRRVVLLAVTEIDGGEAIELACAGRSCPFKTKSRSARAGASVVRLERLFRGRRLRPGTKLTVAVRRSDGATRTVVFTTRRRGKPRRSMTCVTPPSTVPAPC